MAVCFAVFGIIHAFSFSFSRTFDLFVHKLISKSKYTILRKTTNFLSLQDMFRQNFCHLQLSDLQRKLNNK